MHNPIVHVDLYAFDRKPMSTYATLYIVPTPIGNLEDITLRSIRILKEADLIVCEDTRTSGILLKHLEIQKPLFSFHAHNEHRVFAQLVEMLKKNQTLALITDAGTPGISDPGFLLVRACKEAKIPVICLPGATAFVPALVQSGLPCEKFTFIGFLPQKKGRQTALKRLAETDSTTVLYESPHRIVKLLEELKSTLGETRLISVSRELTKKFEETITDTIENVYHYFTQKEIKGEFVVVISPKP